MLIPVQKNVCRKTCVIHGVDGRIIIRAPPLSLSTPDLSAFAAVAVSIVPFLQLFASVVGHPGSHPKSRILQLNGTISSFCLRSPYAPASGLSSLSCGSFLPRGFVRASRVLRPVCVEFSSTDRSGCFVPFSSVRPAVSVVLAGCPLSSAIRPGVYCHVRGPRRVAL